MMRVPFPPQPRASSYFYANNDAMIFFLLLITLPDLQETERKKDRTKERKEDGDVKIDGQTIQNDKICIEIIRKRAERTGPRSRNTCS